jgi:hypothetical protein
MTNAEDPTATSTALVMNVTTNSGLMQDSPAAQALLGICFAGFLQASC